MLVHFLQGYRFAVVNSTGKALSLPGKLDTKIWNTLISKSMQSNQRVYRQAIDIKSTPQDVKFVLEKTSSILNYDKLYHTNPYEIAVLAVALKNSPYAEIRQFRENCLQLLSFLMENPQPAAEGRGSRVQGGKLFKKALVQQSITSIAELPSEEKEYMIRQIVEQFTLTVNKSTNKYRKAIFRNKLADFLNFALEHIHTIQTLKFIVLALNQIKYIDMKSSTKSRMARIMTSLESKIRNLIIANPSMMQEVPPIADSHSDRLQYPYIEALMRCIYMFEAEIQGGLKFYIDFICSDTFLPQNTPLNVRISSYLFMLENSATYLDEKLEHPVKHKLRQLYEMQPSKFIPSLGQNNNRIVSSLMKQRFYCEYMKLKTETISGSIVIKQKPQLPELEPFVKQLLDKLQKCLVTAGGSFMPFVEMLISFYPQLFTQATIDNFKKAGQPRKGVFVDNEQTARIAMALDKLGLSYEREMKIVGKSVDFLVDKKIVIECDGEFHVDFGRYDVSVDTAYRNMLILYSGYSMVVIDIYDMAQHRSVASMQQVLQRKIDTITQQGAVLVQ